MENKKETITIIVSFIKKNRQVWGRLRGSIFGVRILAKTEKLVFEPRVEQR